MFFSCGLRDWLLCWGGRSQSGWSSHWNGVASWPGTRAHTFNRRTTRFPLKSRDDLVAATSHGLYVTSMMGFGFNGVTGDFSRGASGFLIRDGELTEPVSEVTISLNLDQLLQRIDAVADDLDQRTAVASPTFRVSSMTLAGS